MHKNTEISVRSQKVPLTYTICKSNYNYYCKYYRHHHSYYHYNNNRYISDEEDDSCFFSVAALAVDADPHLALR